MAAVSRQWLARQLALMAIVYNTGHSREELALLSDVWLEDFINEDSAAVAEAFTLHRRESARFPTPADVLRKLSFCRRAVPGERRLALEQDTPADHGHVARMSRLVQRALRGDTDAQSFLAGIGSQKVQ